MPKSKPPKGTKRKNAGVGVDFRRVKHKVGKKLAPAQNATDTNFKARSITLPGQSVTEDKQGAAVNQRNLTLKELLGQVGHYSEKVRKEALLGLVDLLKKHPKELKRHTGPVLEKLAERITDVDKAVREALRGLLAGAVLPLLAGGAIVPFLPLLVAHVSSAMTHLANDVRADALGFLEVLMMAAPQQLSSTFLTPALQHYADLLSSASRGRSVSARSLASLLKVVTSLRSFLGGAATASLPASSTNSVASTAPHNDSQHDVLFWQRCDWPPLVDAEAGTVSIESLIASLLAPQATPQLPRSGHSHQRNAAQGKGQGKAGAAMTAAKPTADAAMGLVLGRLLECWAECAPGQLADIPELTATQCMEAILQCANLLLDQMGQAGTPAHKRAWEASILRKVVPYVPVSAPVVKPAPAMHQALVQLNLAAAQLLARFLPASPGGVQHVQGYGVAGAAGGGSSQEAEWVGRLLDYYVGIMEHGQVLPSRGGLTHETTQSSIPGDVYTVVLAGVKQALPSVSPARRSALLGATAALAQRSGARSPVRTACLKFQHALLASPEATFYPHPVTGAVLMTEEQAAGWVEAMPRLLWELGSSRPESSRLALRLLLDAGRYASPNGAISQTLTSLQPQLAPFFCSLLPVAAAAAASKKAQKGGSKGQQSGTLPAKAGGKADKVFTPGPLAKLPADCQTLAVDLLYFLPSISEVTLRTVALLALSSSYPIALATRAVAIVARRGNDADPAQFLSWLLTLLVGRSAHLPADGDWRRHTAVVEAACHAMQTYGKPGEVLQLLAPALVQLCTDSGDRRAWFGALQAATTAAQASTACSSIRNSSSSTSVCMTLIPTDSTAGAVGTVSEVPVALGSNADETAMASTGWDNDAALATSTGAHETVAATAPDSDEPCGLPAQLLAALPHIFGQYCCNCEAFPPAGAVVSHVPPAASMQTTTQPAGQASNVLNQTGQSSEVAAGAAGSDTAGSRAADPGLQPCLALLHAVPALLAPCIQALATCADRQAHQGPQQDAAAIANAAGPLHAAALALQAICEDENLKVPLLLLEKELSAAAGALQSRTEAVVGSVTEAAAACSQACARLRSIVGDMFGQGGN